MHPKLIFFALILAGSLVSANSDADVTHDWCKKSNGIHQYQSNSPTRHTRIDCLTEIHAVEVEVLKDNRHIYEAIGQSLAYAAETGKRAKIVGVIEDQVGLRNAVWLKYIVQTTESKIDLEWVDYRSVAPEPPTATADPQNIRICKKNCTTGIACGNSCIARTKTCREPPGTACDAN